MLERRVNIDGRAATADVPRLTVGGLRMAALDLEATADFMIEATNPDSRIGRPLFLTSANGEVLARCSTERIGGAPVTSPSRWSSATTSSSLRSVITKMAEGMCMCRVTPSSYPTSEARSP